MVRSSKDIQLLELKDTIAQLNNLISSLQKTIDNLNLQLANKDAELNYFKSKLFGSSSERFKTPIPGQLSLFEELNDDRTPELIEAEDIQVEAPLVPHSYSSYKHYIGTAKFVLYVGLLSGY